MLDELSKETGRYQTIISKLQTALGELDLKSGK